MAAQARPLRRARSTAPWSEGLDAAATACASGPCRERHDADGQSCGEKYLLFPNVPAKPVALFIYMYLIRLGMLDGRTGLRFCLYHAWFEVTVAALRADSFPNR